MFKSKASKNTNKNVVLIVGVVAGLVLLSALVCLASCSSNQNATGSAGQARIAAHEESPFVDEAIQNELIDEVSDVEETATSASGDPIDSFQEEPSKTAQSNTGESNLVGGRQSDRTQSAEATQAQPQKRWVEDTQKIWVVDKAAWTETKPIYETRERSICNICGSDITGNTTPHNKAHMLAGEGSGYHSEVVQVQVGTEAVSHPEEGHWETKVVGGHWK